MTASPSLRFDHLMLPVADLERSIAFYAKALSMKVVGRRENDRQWVAHVGWAERGAGATLELAQSRVAAPVGALPEMHFAVTTDDLDALARTWRRDAPELSHAADKALLDKEPRVWICDPDGHLIEVMRPTRQPASA